MGKLAFMFPGQGSQTSGMGKSFWQNSAGAKKVFAMANAVLNRNITKICFEDSDEELKQTINSQPSILAVSLAALELFYENSKVRPDYVLGHSLGEVSAYYAAGVLTLEDTFKLIQKRADAMQRAAQKTNGKMAAVIKADLNLIEDCLNMSKGAVSIANYNSAQQIVITGVAQDVDRVCEMLIEKGVKRVVPLAVSGAFHSWLMRDAAAELSDFISEIKFSNAKIPVITNFDAQMTVNANDFKVKIIKQIYSSVRWCESVENLVNNGVDTFIEFGSGKVLSGLVKKINPDVNVYNISEFEDVKNVTEILGDR